MTKYAIVSKNMGLLWTIAILGTILVVAPLKNLPSASNSVLCAKSGDCGPMDIAGLDDTGSMGGAIENIKSELPSIINDANIASGNI